MLTRRQLMKRGAAGGVGLTFASHLTAVAAPKTLTPFVDELTDLASPGYVLTPSPGDANTFDVAIANVKHTYHSMLGQTDMWGYGSVTYDDVTGAVTGVKTALSPGPTIVVQEGTPTTVKYHNMLSGGALFPIDPTLEQLLQDNHGVTIPPVRTITHLHGGFVSDADDGNPYRTHLADEYEPGKVQTAHYLNKQEPALAWYHDHAMAITRQNVMAGLFGGYLIQPDPNAGGGNKYTQQFLNLPVGVPMVIQDREFVIDPLTGLITPKLFYPHPWVPEFFARFACVNGQVWPKKTVDPGMHRLRLLNGSNSRFYSLRLFDTTAGVRMPMTVIGNDLGCMAAPAVAKELTLAPAERADVIVDFTGKGGNLIVMRNMRLPQGVVSPAGNMLSDDVLQFNVNGTGGGQIAVPANLPRKPALGAATRTIVHTLEEVMNVQTGLPTAALIDGKMFEDPLQEVATDWEGTGGMVPGQDVIKNGEIVELDIVNLTADTHPIHVHLVDFEVVARWDFDAAGYLGALNARRPGWNPDPFVPGGRAQATAGWMGELNPNPAGFLGKRYGPDPTETGPKDTVMANPKQVTRIKARFDASGAGQTTFPAKYVWHCHILEHEDREMHRPYEVVTAYKA